ncbi:LysR substrate-binding domain-containing protein [Lacisediminimonas profundi]|uniref:LysR substrate-binding domain-containing protein n=1 Tax=Lacisediminimonas profundi TaxID=2603856 RepID=UPI0013872259|nr:LysR substrate-binding domain-containing protein [Lacisediminimonas profundi]
MDIRQLRYFLAVAETQHMTRAAEQLNVTQSTLSHRIQQIELALKTPLFDRVGRGIRLTQAGELFSSFAQRAMKEIENGMAAVSDLENVVTGRLRIGVIQTINNALLPPVVSRFVEAYPGVQVTLDEMTAHNIEEGLAHARLDFGISIIPVTSPDVVAERLFDERMVLIARRDSPLAQHRSIRAAALADIKLALLSTSYMTRRLIDSSYGPFIGSNLVLETNSVEALLNTVRAGNVATIINERTLIKEDELVKVVITHPTSIRVAALVWSKTRYRTPAARKFAEMFKEHLAA